MMKYAVHYDGLNSRFNVTKLSINNSFQLLNNGVLSTTRAKLI